MATFYEDTGWFVLPDLRQVQMRSIRRFFQMTLLAQFKWFGSLRFVSFDGHFQFQLMGGAYRLESPRLNERDAVHASTTYASNLYVPAQLVGSTRVETEEQILCLGSVPLVSASGTFVINGVPRCVVNQRLTAPGIYYTLNARGTYLATIVAESGRRLRLELDTEQVLSVRVTREDKISVGLLLVCLGLDKEHVPMELRYCSEDSEDSDDIEDWPEFSAPGFQFSSLAKRELPVILRELLSEGLKRRYKLVRRPLIRRTLYWQDMLIRPYGLGVRGRLSVNRALYPHGVCAAPKNTRLNPLDILIACQRLLEAGDSALLLDNIDELGHKHVKSAGEVMNEQLKFLLEEFTRRMIRRMSKASIYERKCLSSPKRLLGCVPLRITFDQFFGSYALSQFLDQTNPLADIIHKRRLSALGPGGLTPRTATFKSRDIQPSQYGRVCPVDTAEGQNAGIVTSLTVCAEVDSKGRIKNALRAANTMWPRDCRTGVFLASQDRELSISTGGCLSVIPSVYDRTTTSAQYRRELTGMPSGQAQFRCILPVHYFSVGVTLVPFLEHNDATRALMGSTMQRQAVPLLRPEKPVVGTGLEGQVALDSGTLVTARESGRIEYADGEVVCNVEASCVHWSSKLLSVQKSNHSTSLHQRPTVRAGESVRRGQLLADGAATAGGELALGKNVLVAYMPWEGYNFEDAVLISERLVDDDVYTSMHIDRYEAEAQQAVEGDEVITRHIPHVSQYLLRHLDERGVARLGSWVEAGDVLVGKLSAEEGVGPDPERRLLRAIFGLNAACTRESCLKVPLRAAGRVIDVRWVAHERLDRVSGALRQSQAVHVFVLQRRKIQVGDKVAGRHGNKGVVSRIVASKDMPYCQDGRPVDMVLSPLGVPSRMNVGQILECLLGLSGEWLAKHYRIAPFDERYEAEASRKLALSELYRARESTGLPWLFEYDSPGKSQLFDGRSGSAFEQAATIGRAYMLKLIHQVDDKIHARSTGPYALVTQQPVRGRARQGGQRLGEMEVWALLGFGAAHVLQEMILSKSDHVTARAHTVSAITSGIPVPTEPVGPQDSLRLLVRELLCLGIQLNHSVVCQRDLTSKPSEM